MHLTPALDKIRQDQISIQNQYEIALKDTRNKGKELSIDNIIRTRNYDRISNKSVKTMPQNKLTNFVSENQSENYSRLPV